MKRVYCVPMISRAVRDVYVTAESAAEARDLVTSGERGVSVGVEYDRVHPGRVRLAPREDVEAWERAEAIELPY